MNDELLQAYAHLTVHNHVLTQILGRLLGAMPEDEARDILDAIVSDSDFLKAPEDASAPADDAARIINDAQVLIERFANKVWSAAQAFRDSHGRIFPPA